MADSNNTITPGNTEAQKQEGNLSLWGKFLKIQFLCKAMEEISNQLADDCPNLSDLEDKAWQVYHLASTIKDLLVVNENYFLDGLEKLERIIKVEDGDDFMHLWTLLRNQDRKILMRHAIAHTQKIEEEYPPSKPGSYLYDIRRSLAKKYGVALKEVS